MTAMISKVSFIVSVALLLMAPRSCDATTASHVQCGWTMCAILISDGSIFTWGAADNNGIDFTSGFVELDCHKWACAARKDDGSVVVWGSPDHVGTDVDLGFNTTGLGLDSGVVNITAFEKSFAALKDDGSWVVWGGYAATKNLTGVDLTAGVADVSCGDKACVARMSNGSAIVWGSEYYGGDPALTHDQQSVDLSSNVVDARCGGRVCWARKSDGSAHVWGYLDDGGNGWLNCPDCPNDGTQNVNQYLLSGIVDIGCGYGGVCYARKDDSSAAIFGSFQDNVSSVDLTSGIADMSCGEKHSSSYTCVALKSDGSVITFGRWAPSDLVNNEIFAAGVSVLPKCYNRLCVALKDDGSYFSWGDPDLNTTKASIDGNDNGDGIDLTNLKDLQCEGVICFALRNTGTVIFWADTPWDYYSTGVLYTPCTTLAFVENDGCTFSPSSSPSSAPTSSAPSTSTSSPSSAPTSSAPTSSAPTSSPTSAPTSSPTSAPTSSPTSAPSSSPTSAPTSTPTTTPTPAGEEGEEGPTGSPTEHSTSSPTNPPTPVDVAAIGTCLDSVTYTKTAALKCFAPLLPSCADPALKCKSCTTAPASSSCLVAVAAYMGTQSVAAAIPAIAGINTNYLKKVRVEVAKVKVTFPNLLTPFQEKQVTDSTIAAVATTSGISASSLFAMLTKLDARRRNLLVEATEYEVSCEVEETLKEFVNDTFKESLDFTPDSFKTSFLSELAKNDTFSSVEVELLEVAALEAQLTTAETAVATNITTYIAENPQTSQPEFSAARPAGSAPGVLLLGGLLFGVFAGL